jgi:hypothetical protein
LQRSGKCLSFRRQMPDRLNNILEQGLIRSGRERSEVF